MFWVEDNSVASRPLSHFPGDLIDTTWHHLGTPYMDNFCAPLGPTLSQLWDSLELTLILFWGKFGTILWQLWDNLGQLWYKLETTLGHVYDIWQVGNNFGTTLRQLQDNLETTLWQLCDKLETTMGQLWDQALWAAHDPFWLWICQHSSAWAGEGGSLVDRKTGKIRDEVRCTCQIMSNEQQSYFSKPDLTRWSKLGGEGSSSILDMGR